MSSYEHILIRTYTYTCTYAHTYICSYVRIHILRQKMILEMMSQTSLEQDVCVFYLESTEWDLNKALEFVKSMS